MASSEVDQKFLGKFAKAVERDNPLLSSMLFKILGLSINLSQHLLRARKQRKLDTTRATQSLDLYFHIIWLAREGSVMLEQYVLPMIGNYTELKVLAYKLRASFYHIFVLFHNQPPVTTQFLSTPEAQFTATLPNLGPSRLDKGKGIARDEDLGTAHSSLQPHHPLEGGPVGPPPGFGPEPAAAFLLPAVDYLPLAHRYFKEASVLADELLWGSHSLRLSVKTEYSAFLYECVHNEDASRKLAKATINEVYEAAEGIDNDMFNDACELVTVLGRMMKRGTAAAKASSSGTPGTQKGTPPKAPPEASGQQRQQQQQPVTQPAIVPPVVTAPAPPGGFI